MLADWFAECGALLRVTDCGLESGLPYSDGARGYVDASDFERTHHLFEACAKISLDAMRVLGGYGFMADFPVERFYRDAPLMMIGEGTNEIQALVIARGLLARYRI